jgi:hypothetical protein
MVHLDRIREEIRVLKLGNEKLLSEKIFLVFTRRLDYFNSIHLGLSPESRIIDELEMKEEELLNEYIDLFKDNFPCIYSLWSKKC